MAAAEGAGCVVISAAIEEELARLDDAERAEYLEAMGLHEPGLDRLIREGYRLLGLSTYFTAGPKEARAWTIPADASAPGAAGSTRRNSSKARSPTAISSDAQRAAAPCCRCRKASFRRIPTR